MYQRKDKRKTKLVISVVIILVTLLMPLIGSILPNHLLNVQQVLAGGEANVDSMDVNPTWRWDDEQTDDVTMGVSESELGLTTMNESIYTSSRALQKTKDTIEVKALVPTTNSQTNVGIRKDEPDSVSVDQNYYFTDETDELVALWEMNFEVGSSNMRDLSGNDHLLTRDEATLNSTTYTGYSEYSLYMNSYHGDNYAYSLDHDDFSFVDGSGDTPFSLEAWINLESLTGSQSIISKYGSSGNIEWILLKYVVTNRIVFIISDTTATTHLFIESNALVTSEWYHVIATYDGSEEKEGLNVYLNGVNDTLSRSESGTYVGMSNTAQNVELGRADSGSHFDGLIDDVKIHSKELDADTIKRYYYEGRKGEVLNLKMNEGSGTTAYDSSNDHDATLVNTPTWSDSSVDSEYYSCLDFDYLNDEYLSINDHNDLEINYGFTMSVWIYPTSIGSYGRGIFEKGLGVNSYSLHVYGNGLYFYCKNSSVVNNFEAVKSGAFSVNEWYFVQALIEDNGLMKLYINGAEITSYNKQDTVSGSLLGTSNELLIGKYSNTRFWEGKMDELAIYQRALTASEIAYLYTNQSTLLIQNRLEKKIPTTDTDGNTVRIVFERDYESGNSICYGAFENYQNETIKSSSGIYHYYSSNEVNKWLIIKLKYDTRRSDYKFLVEFLNGTEILDVEINDFSEQKPSISNYSTFNVYYSFNSVEKTYSELRIDYVKASFKEQEWKGYSTSGNGDFNCNYQGFSYDSSDNVYGKNETWVLDVPYFDSCMGKLVFSVKNFELWASGWTPGLVGNEPMRISFKLYTVNPNTGALIDSYMGFYAFSYVSTSYSFFYLSALSGGSGSFVQYEINNTVLEIDFSYQYDKDNQLLKMGVTCEEFLQVMEKTYEWEPQEFVLKISYYGNGSTTAMATGDYLSFYLTEWDLKARDLFADLIHFIPGAGEAVETIGQVGNLIVILIRAVSQIIEGVLQSLDLIGSVILSLINIFVIISLIVDQISNLPTTIFNVFNTILTAISDSLDLIDTTLGNLPSAVFNAFNAILTDIENAILGLAGAVWSEFSTVLGAIDDYLADMGNIVFTAFTDILDDIWTIIGSVASDVLGGMLAIFVDGMEALWNAFAPFISDLVTYWIDAMVALIAYLWNNLVDPFIAFVVDFLFTTFPELKALWDWLWQLVIFFFDELEPLIDTIAYVLTFVWTVILLLSELLLASLDFLSQLTDLITDVINNNYVLTYTLGVFIPAYQIDVEILSKVMKFTVVPEISIVLMEFNFAFNLLPSNFPISGSFSDLWFWIIGTLTGSIIGLYLIVTACMSCIINSAKGRFEWGAFFDTWYNVAIDKPLNGVMYMRNFIPLI